MLFFFPFNYLHVRCWLDIAEGRMIRMGVEKVQGDGDVVILTPVWHRDRALVIKIFFLVIRQFVIFGMVWYNIVRYGTFSTYVLLPEC